MPGVERIQGAVRGPAAETLSPGAETGTIDHLLPDNRVITPVPTNWMDGKAAVPLPVRQGTACPPSAAGPSSTPGPGSLSRTTVMSRSAAAVAMMFVTTGRASRPQILGKRRLRITTAPRGP
jgi:hypothetical protein